MSISKQNNQAVTLATYRAGVSKYLEGTADTVEGTLKNYLDVILKKIPPDATILEVGSGGGKDADYIELHGHTVQRSDAVEGFVSLMKERDKNAVVFNVLTDNLNKEYDVVIATAVLLHFTESQVTAALQNMHKHLSKSGLLVIAVKPGKGEEYSDRKMGAPRFFKYWEKDDLSKIVEENGFLVEECRYIADGAWLECHARKVG